MNKKGPVFFEFHHLDWNIWFKPAVRNFCLPLLAVRVITKTPLMSSLQTPDAFNMGRFLPWGHDAVGAHWGQQSQTNFTSTIAGWVREIIFVLNAYAINIKLMVGTLTSNQKSGRDISHGPYYNLHPWCWANYLCAPKMSIPTLSMISQTWAFLYCHF